MRRALRIFGWLTIVVLVLGLGMAGGVVLDRQVLNQFIPPANLPPQASGDFQLMAEAWNTIENSYVARSTITAQQLTYGAISGMVNALGDTGHSRFLTPAMIQQESILTSGQFEGIGATVSYQNNQVNIVSTMDGSPAQAAKLRSGDVIEKVNGETVSGLSLSDVVSKIMGPAGTTVTLTILDPTTQQTRDVTLQRARIQIKYVSWSPIPGTTIAHLRIAEFGKGTTADLKKALGEINAQNMTGIVLDLRNNPGGLLDESIGVASQFLSSGYVLQEKDAQGNIQSVPVKPGGMATKIPMVVLVNQGTASAAEIVAGALQDAHRAELVGETTFGTGTVLNNFTLSDGSQILLATQEWLTPEGRVIWHQGIIPDIKVSLAADAIPLQPDSETGLSANQVKASSDTQLLRGLQVLDQPQPQITPSTP